MVFDIQDWYKQNQDGEVIVNFFGVITPEAITSTLDFLEKKLEQSNEKNLLRKKIYNVFTECFQNLYHHVDTPPKDFGLNAQDQFGVIVLIKNEALYRITTGNFVKKEKSKLLKERIEQLNSLSENELKELYRAILSNDEYSKKGGGGLGMLDIVRKTGKKIDYHFHNVNDEYYFFSLDVYIS